MTRPYSPGFGLCVCSTVGRSRRRIRHSSAAARRSDHGLQPRVDAASGTWRTPRCSIAATNGPGALIPMASPPAATTASSCASRSSARLMSTVVRWATRSGRAGSAGGGSAVRARRTPSSSRPGAWSTPSPRRTMPTVRARMRTSRASDAWSTYQTSMASRSSHPRRVAPVHLGPAGDARPDLQPAGLGVVVPGQVRHRQRPRPDERHVAAHHVERASAARRGSSPAGTGRPGSGAPTSCCGPASSGRAGRIVRNLTSSNGRPPRPLRAWRNSTGGPSRIRTTTAIASEQRRGDHEQRGGDDDVDRPLHHDRDPTARRAATTSTTSRGDGDRRGDRDRVGCVPRCGRRRRRSRPAARPTRPAGRGWARSPAADQGGTTSTGRRRGGRASPARRPAPVRRPARRAPPPRPARRRGRRPAPSWHAPGAASDASTSTTSTAATPTT